MAPKKDPKKELQAAALPSIEDEVLLPEELSHFSDPPFACVVAHVVSHNFTIESKAADDDSVALQEFDPCAALLSKLKEESLEDPMARWVVPIEREELLPLSEGGPLVKGLRKKIEAESRSRRMRKVNAARSQAIAELRGGQGAAAAPAAAAPATAPAADAAAPSGPDLVLVLLGFPADGEELAEVLREELLGAPELSLWASVYLAGASLREEPAEAEGEAAPRRGLRACEPPEVLQQLHRAICRADRGALANSTLCTLPDSQLLALSAEGAGGAVLSAVLAAARTQLERRLEFDEWVGGGQRVSVPELQRGACRPDTRLYNKLMNCIAASHQDVPALLDCLCEQVAFSLSGDKGGGGKVAASHAVVTASTGHDAESDDAAESNVLKLAEEYLDEAHERITLGDVYATALDSAQVAAGARIAELEASTSDSVSDEPTVQPTAEPQQSEMLVLPHADSAACLHANDELPGGVSVAGAVTHLLSHLCAPGMSRAGFPAKPPLSAAQRSSARNRTYAFLPEVGVAKIDQMLLHEEFEHLMEAKQPERKWFLGDRLVRERIPASMLANAYLKASQLEGFADSEYVPQRDCLLVALHHRSLPGHVLWHAWVGDLSRLADEAASSAGEEGEEGTGLLCPVPSFNDWWHVVGSRARAPGSPPLPPPARFLEHDARDIGYCRVVEKLLMPSDGSVILRTTLQRGQWESLPAPGAEGTSGPEAGRASDKATQEKAASASCFVAPPRFELQSVRVIKGSIAFGMVSDGAWMAKVARLWKRQSTQTEAVAQADLTGAVGGEPSPSTGLEQAEEGSNAADSREGTPEGSAPRTAVTERRLEDLRFGTLWVAFPGGARCTIRMHHERPWFSEGAQLYDVVLARPGALLTFTPASTVSVQVFSDGSVLQAWPLQVTGSSAARSPQSGRANHTRAQASGLTPGSPEDMEVARTVTPFGVLIRSFLSGRKEILHPDGTQAVRNPTLQEVEAQRDRFRDCACGPPPELLEGLLAGAQAHARQLAGRQPSMQEKAAGLPGHWRVTRPDGRRFGRMALVPTPPQEELPASPESVGAAGAAGAAGTAGAAGAADAADAQGPAAPRGAPADGHPSEWASVAKVLEQVEGVLVDGGEVVEYEIDPISVSTLTDPHTGQSASSNVEGLLILEEAQSAAGICLLPDGTRMAYSQHEEGYSVTIEGEGAAQVTCRVNSKTLSPNVSITVMCDDGTRLEVTPRRLNHKGELVPSDPSLGASDRFSTNASVLLRRPDDIAILSGGSGKVDIFGGPEAETVGEAEDLQTIGDRGGVYVAHLDRDSIQMRDSAGNAFEVHGEQSVGFKLAVSMGDDFPSPRCRVPGQCYGHPDAKYLPLPEQTAPPRLFVVSGSGDAEELITVGEAEEALRLAAKDPRAIVLRNEALGQPLEGCCCHTILLPGSVAPASAVAPKLPPSIAGLRGDGSRGAQRPSCAFTELRQFVQYPPISGEQRQAFLEAQARFAAWEGEWCASHAAFHQGPQQKPPGALRPPAREPAEGGA